MIKVEKIPAIKQTSLGPIPSDWEVSKLNDVIMQMTDYVAAGSFESLRENVKVYDDKDFALYVRLFDLRLGLGHQEQKFVDEKSYTFLRKSNLFGNEILMANIGANVGETWLMPEVSLPATIAPNMIVIRADNNKVLYNFLFYYTHSPLGVSKLKELIAGSGHPKINKGELKTLVVPVPPLIEQKAIAHILGLMDSTINKNNQFIAKKELQKKWLMRNLLTGKKRLKEFSEEWKEIHIKDVSKEVSIRNKADNQLTVLSCTKYDGLVPSLEYFGRKIFSDDVSTYKVVPKNHFAYATNHIEEGSIGYQETLEEALISPMYTVFKTDSSINDNFFYKLLKSHKLVYQYKNRMEGSIDRRGGLRWDGFSIIKVQIPSYKEQTAIAEVLQSADKEIQLLKSKTEKLREQKKGLMQVLLTGRKRLIV